MNICCLRLCSRVGEFRVATPWSRGEFEAATCSRVVMLANGGDLSDAITVSLTRAYASVPGGEFVDFDNLSECDKLIVLGVARTYFGDYVNPDILTSTYGSQFEKFYA